MALKKGLSTFDMWRNPPAQPKIRQKVSPRTVGLKLDLTALNRQTEVPPKRPPLTEFNRHDELTERLHQDVRYEVTKTHYWYLIDGVYYYARIPENYAPRMLDELWAKIERVVRARGGMTSKS